MTDSDEGAIEGQDAESVEEFSLKLRNAREAQELSVDEIAAELRIGANMLKALEDSRLDELGAPVFAKGYLKQYGARLGLDVSELIADYERVVGDQNVEIEPSKTIQLRDERQITVWVIGAAVLLLLAVVLWAWWWLGTDPVTETAPEPAAAPDPAAEVSTETAPEPAVETAAEAVTEAAFEPAAAATDAVTGSAIEPATDLAADQAISEPVVPVAELPDDPLPAAIETAVAGPVLEILFVEDSWTEISSANGDRLFYDLGRAGSREVVPADQDMDLFFGNAAGVRLILDGEAFDIPPSARRGDLAEFNLEAVVE